MSNDKDVAANDPANNSKPASVPKESGYGSPTPEEEMPAGHASTSGPADEQPLEAPSTDAPINDGNADSARGDRESFSSEPDEDASGA
ncbi:hypothetical protein [Arthrobacter sp. E3]|uniref:hypothetical protein n=1 Tax=Arthrobacter sp. E3 TaxID=517402 RepID=UPI001A93E647|nr:hypothetical protein [Arthrobacter sp. E3]